MTESQHIAILRAALGRLLAAYQADYETMPEETIRISWETNGQAIYQARKAMKDTE